MPLVERAEGSELEQEIFICPARRSSVVRLCLLWSRRRVYGPRRTDGLLAAGPFVSSIARHEVRPESVHFSLSLPSCASIEQEGYSW